MSGMNRKQRRTAQKQRPIPAPTRLPFLDEALQHHKAGRLDQAGDLYLRALTAAPANTDALHLLAVLRLQQGRHSEAIELNKKAIATKPDYPAAHANLGVALIALGKLDEAVAAFRQAVTIKPDFVEAHCNLATALRHLGKLDEAVDCLQRVIAIKPDFAEAHSTLGSALASLGKFDEAVGSCRQAIAIKPDYPEAHNNLGVALTLLGKLDEAVTAFRQAIALRPDFADAHGQLGLSLLLSGDLRQGFEEYRWRWRSPNFPRMPALSCPLWEGESLSGKSILVHCEQGYGDSLQFIRYAIRLSRMAARVTVLAPQQLASLFRSIPGIEVVTDLMAKDQGYDCHIPLLCLPRLLGTGLDTIPADVPYLSADATKIERWAERLSQYKGRLKTGLVWAGAPRRNDPASHAVDRRRSMALHQFAPLLGISNIQFISLQKGAPAEQARDPPTGMELVDAASDLDDFEDTAALVANLDLVISVDTSVAHLAGALAKPVWILSRFDGCWRWLKDREDSPWYPTARIFRQKTSGDWDEVIVRVRTELVKLLQSRL